MTFQSHFNDNTLTPVTTRHYRVRSFNDGGESANSNVVSGTTPTLVPQDAGPLVYGRTDSRLDSLRDQKVFTADLGADAEYLFAVVGVAAYHRVEVTAPGGTKIFGRTRWTRGCRRGDSGLPRRLAPATPAGTASAATRRR